MKLARLLLVALVVVSTSAFAGKVKTEDEALELTLKAIHKYHLMTLKDECVEAEIDDKALRFDVVIRELHNVACGGDPETGPRLFTMRVRKRDGRLTSDVYDSTSYRLVNRKLGASKM